jgi:mitochondrial fission protein ELM1
LAIIWVLTGSKPGDNAQVLRAARAVDLPFEIRNIAIKPKYDAAKLRVRPSLHHVDLAASDRLEGPWPDLVITIGRRLSLAALWIKQQSGGKTRVALFNAPKGKSGAFDLLVVPPFYRVGDKPNVLRIGLPLVAVDESRLAAAKTEFAKTFHQMERPLHVLLLGGDMGMRKLDTRFALDTLQRMRASFASKGSIFISTSRRTPTAVADALEGALRPQDRLFRWGDAAAPNPYLGLLAHGDTFTVTSDSLSMLIEVARLGKPLAIAEPPEITGLRGLVNRILSPFRARDLSEATALLLRGGYAVPLGETPKAPPQPPPDDTARVAARLRALAEGRS